MTPVDGINFSQYKIDVLNRFGNKNIKDTVSRICNDGATKIKKFILPIIYERLHSSQSINALSMTIASWIYFIYHLQINNDDNKINEYYDPIADKLQLINRAKTNSYAEINDIKNKIITCKDVSSYIFHFPLQNNAFLAFYTSLRTQSLICIPIFVIFF